MWITLFTRKEAIPMDNAHMYTRMLAEDVNVAELSIDYMKNHKCHHRESKPLFNKKEALAESVLSDMKAREAGLGLIRLKKIHVPNVA